MAGIRVCCFEAKIKKDMLTDKKIDCSIPLYSCLLPTLCLVILSTSHSTCYIHVVCTPMYVVSAYILDGMASAAVVKERVISDH